MRLHDLGVRSTATEIAIPHIGARYASEAREMIAAAQRSPFGTPLILLALCLVSLGVHHQWITPSPLSYGDWPLISNDQVVHWFPWPSVWSSESGFGTKNFAGIYQYPIEAVAGGFAQLG